MLVVVLVVKEVVVEAEILMTAREQGVLLEQMELEVVVVVHIITMLRRVVRA